MEQQNAKRHRLLRKQLPGEVNPWPPLRLAFTLRGRAMRPELAACLILIVGATVGVSREKTPSEKQPSNRLPALLRTPTMGGKQFWSDQFIHPPWRIQRHVLTDVCRLLDGSDRAVIWGNYSKCLAEFEQVKRQQHVPPLKSRVVIVLHGAIRSRSSMDPICQFLEKRTGYLAINVSYASTRAKISQHAIALRKIIEQLAPQVKEINFVAHSMGNLVIRHYLQDLKLQPRKSAVTPRLGRIVMLAPPNQGTELAARVRNNPIFLALWGVSGGEMATWKTLEPRLGIPDCEFGIIAGNPLPNQQGNPLIEGPDDLVVGVQETQLPGAHDFLVLPVSHSTIMHDQHVQDATLRFLQRGHFRSAALRQPIPAIAQPGPTPNRGGTP
ncbi:MAG: alpha/beta hydrolase [Planctomycetota bacterium]|nr:alpha/beta hydrolase [Planctomycetota bacterium]